MSKSQKNKKKKIENSGRSNLNSTQSNRSNMSSNSSSIRSITEHSTSNIIQNPVLASFSHSMDNDTPSDLQEFLQRLDDITDLFPAANTNVLPESNPTNFDTHTLSIKRIKMLTHSLTRYSECRMAYLKWSIRLLKAWNPVAPKKQSIKQTIINQRKNHIIRLILDYIVLSIELEYGGMELPAVETLDVLMMSLLNQFNKPHQLWIIAFVTLSTPHLTMFSFHKACINQLKLYDMPMMSNLNQLQLLTKTLQKPFSHIMELTTYFKSCNEAILANSFVNLLSYYCSNVLSGKVFEQEDFTRFILSYLSMIFLADSSLLPVVLYGALELVDHQVLSNLLILETVGSVSKFRNNEGHLESFGSTWGMLWTQIMVLNTGKLESIFSRLFFVLVNCKSYLRETMSKETQIASISNLLADEIDRIIWEIILKNFEKDLLQANGRLTFIDFHELLLQDKQKIAGKEFYALLRVGFQESNLDSLFELLFVNFSKNMDGLGQLLVLHQEKLCAWLINASGQFTKFQPNLIPIILERLNQLYDVVKANNSVENVYHELIFRLLKNSNELYRIPALYHCFLKISKSSPSELTVQTIKLYRLLLVEVPQSLIEHRLKIVLLRKFSRYLVMERVCGSFSDPYIFSKKSLHEKLFQPKSMISKKKESQDLKLAHVAFLDIITGSELMSAEIRSQIILYLFSTPRRSYQILVLMKDHPWLWDVIALEIKSQPNNMMWSQTGGFMDLLCISLIDFWKHKREIPSVFQVPHVKCVANLIQSLYMTGKVPDVLAISAMILSNVRGADIAEIVRILKAVLDGTELPELKILIKGIWKRNLMTLDPSHLKLFELI
ncbi:hypothetical protein BC833DRAFT_617096 [Globomyces pollinis-pini]|nr:hypothetical protein BC833DRAFT_617096 [Globomyces pollinis-pini]